MESVTRGETGDFPVLALNCGSSSLKFGFYLCGAQTAKLVCEGEAEEIGGAHSSFWITLPDGSKRQERTGFSDHAAALTHALDSANQSGASNRVRYETLCSSISPPQISCAKTTFD